jgi:hypothetical protein
MLADVPGNIAPADYSYHLVVVIYDWQPLDMMPGHCTQTAFDRVISRAGECLIGHAVTDLGMRDVHPSCDKSRRDVAVSDDSDQPS